MFDYEALVKQLYIRTKDPISPIQKFQPNWAQREMLATINDQYNAGKPCRVIVLKARQLGISTLTEALMFWWGFVHPHSNGLVIAHENDASEYLLAMTRFYWDSFPLKAMYSTRYTSRRELSWVETQSNLRVATAANTAAGRGRTYNALHGSEVGFWEHPEELMLGLRQTIPNRHGTLIALESTANGIGDYFHSTWEAAVDREVDYVPLFFPWWKHYEYTASFEGLTNVRLTHMTDDERILKRLGADDDHLLWRRFAMKNLAGGDESKFMQEYPATPEEAFIASGTNVFPLDALKKCYEPRNGVKGFLVRERGEIDFEPDSSGPVTIYKNPSKDVRVRYFIGADPTHTTKGDFACAQVINALTYEQVAVYHGRIDPISFAEELAKLGAFFNDATIATEIEGPGYATIGALIQLNYPNLWHQRWNDKATGKLSETLGWSTTAKRKHWAVSNMLKLLVDGDVTIHHHKTYDEMMKYVTLENGGYGPASESDGGHDDCVMALCIAAVCNMTEGPRSMYQQALMDTGVRRSGLGGEDPLWVETQEM